MNCTHTFARAHSRGYIRHAARPGWCAEANGCLPRCARAASVFLLPDACGAASLGGGGRPVCLPASLPARSTRAPFCTSLLHPLPFCMLSLHRLSIFSVHPSSLPSTPAPHPASTYLDMLQPAFVTALARAQRPTQRHEVQLNTLSQRLTPREQDTARLVLLGMPDKEIARALNISSTTVRTHLENAFRKVGVSNRAALVHKLRA